MTPRVSVVVPAYNNADYIAETLRSILAQTYADFELIVADHSSQDGTWDVVNEFASDPRVRIVRTEAGGGAFRNWNRVSQLASGEFIKLVCGDDLIHPTMLERQLDVITAGDGQDAPVALVASQRNLIDARGEIFLRSRGLGRLHGLVDGRHALRATVRSGGNIFGEPACVLLRRSVLEAAGWWQDMGFYIDAGSYASVLIRGDAYALRESLASFRLSSQQWSVRLAKRQAQEAARFHQAARELAPNVITPSDVRLGNLRAKMVALQRRAAYVALGKRMQPV